jgi:hypothetical protein
VPSDEDEDFIDRRFESNEEEAREKYTFAENVVSRLGAIGVGNMERPVLEDAHDGIFTGLKKGQYFDGRLPTVIRKLSLDQLSALLSLFTNWYDYVLQQAMLVEAELSEAKRKKEFMWAMIRTKIKDQARAASKSISDARISDLARLDSRFVEVDAHFIELDVLHNCMQAMLRAAGHNLKTVSREITVRQVKVEAEARGRGISSDRPPSRFAQVYRPRTEPEGASASLPGLEDEDENEGEVAEPEEAPKQPRKGAVPAKAKGPAARPKIQLPRRK